MMNYNPYYWNNMYNPHASYFANAMQQQYNSQPQQQVQQPQPQTQTQQTITTQPPVIQPQSKIIPVSNKDEATAAPVDLVYGYPTFFYNKGKNEIYLKQFDVPTGTAIFKTYCEIQPIEDTVRQENTQRDINIYEDEFRRLNDGIDSLHRMIAQIKEKPIEIEEIEVEQKGKRK